MTDERLIRVLRLLGFNVEPDQPVGVNRLGLVARARLNFEDVVYLVEYNALGEIVQPTVVDGLKGYLEQRAATSMNARGMIVAPSFSEEALQAARNHGIRALTLDDLERELVDVAPYLEHLRRLGDEARIADWYVEQQLEPLHINGLELRPPRPAVSATIEWLGEWLGDRLLVVFGDVGTGKTTFIRRLAFELAHRHERDQSSPIPLLISLGDYAAYDNRTRLDDILRDHWLRATGRALDPAILLHLLTYGRITLLLDGFDQYVELNQSVALQLEQIVRTGDSGNQAHGRTVITCRSPSSFDAYDVVMATDDVNEILARRVVAARRTSKRCDSLARYTSAQLREFVAQKFGDRGRRALGRIEETHDLDSLADRLPMMAILDRAVPRIESMNGAVGLGAIYREYIEDCLQSLGPRDEAERLNSRRQFFEVLAAFLWDRPGNQAPYVDLIAGGLIRPRLPITTVRALAFAAGSMDGILAFSHQSFLEFFLASYISRRAGTGGLAAALDLDRITPTVAQFLEERCDESEARLIHDGITSLLRDTEPGKAKVNALLLALFLSRSAARSLQPPDALDAARDAMRRKMPTGVSLARTDLSRLDLRGAYLAGVDLTGANLEESDLSFADVSDAIFTDARLTRANLYDAVATRADFRRADVSFAHADRIDLRGAIAAGGDWRGAVLRDARIDGASFAQADMRAATLSGPTKPPLTRLHAVDLRHGVGIQSVAYSPDGARIVTASYDHTARIWDTATGRAVVSLDGHTQWVESAAFSLDGTRVVTASFDRTARVWDAITGRLLLTLDGHAESLNCAAFAADGSRIVTAASDGTARVWDATTGGMLLVLDHQHGSPRPGKVKAAAFASNGASIVTGGQDGSVRIWDAATGQVVLAIQASSMSADSVAFSLDGTRVIAAGLGCGGRMWDATSGRELFSLEGPPGGGVVNHVQLSRDGSRTVATDGTTAILWDATAGRRLLALDGGTGSFGCVAFAPDGTRIAAVSGAAVRIWDAAAGRELMTIGSHANGLSSAAFASDGAQIVTVNRLVARVWKEGRVRHTLEGHGRATLGASFSPDGARIVTAGEDGSARVCDAETGRKLLVLQGDTNQIESARFTPDGATVVTIDSYHVARIWNASNGRLVRSFSLADSEPSVALVPSGTRFVTVGRDGVTRIRDASTGAALGTLESTLDFIRAAAFADDGSRIVMIGESTPETRVHDATSGRAVLTLAGHTSWLYSAAFSPSGTRIVTASNDHTARVWDAATGQTLVTLVGHTDSVQSAMFSPDGARILTAGSDETARIWDARSGIELERLWAGEKGWYSLRFDTGDDLPHFRAHGDGFDRLRFRDRDERPAPAPWIPREWAAADLIADLSLD